MPDPPARRSRRLTGCLQAHRGREGVATAGLPRPGRVFGQFQYLSPPVHADPALKEQAIARTAPLGAKPGRYRPPDALLAFLESL